MEHLRLNVAERSVPRARTPSCSINSRLYMWGCIKFVRSAVEHIIDCGTVDILLG